MDSAAGNCFLLGALLERCVNLDFPGLNPSAVKVITHTHTAVVTSAIPAEPDLMGLGPFSSLLCSGRGIATGPGSAQGAESKPQAARDNGTDPVTPPSNQECLE